VHVQSGHVVLHVRGRLGLGPSPIFPGRFFEGIFGFEEITFRGASDRTKCLTEPRRKQKVIAHFCAPVRLIMARG